MLATARPAYRLPCAAAAAPGWTSAGGRRQLLRPAAAVADRGSGGAVLDRPGFETLGPGGGPATDSAGSKLDSSGGRGLGGGAWRVLLIDSDKHTEERVVQAITTVVPGADESHAANCFHTVSMPPAVHPIIDASSRIRWPGEAAACVHILLLAAQPINKVATVSLCPASHLLSWRLGPLLDHQRPVGLNPTCLPANLPAPHLPAASPCRRGRWAWPSSPLAPRSTQSSTASSCGSAAAGSTWSPTPPSSRPLLARQRRLSLNCQPPNEPIYPIPRGGPSHPHASLLLLSLLSLFSLPSTEMPELAPLTNFILSLPSAHLGNLEIDNCLHFMPARRASAPFAALAVLSSLPTVLRSA